MIRALRLPAWLLLGLAFGLNARAELRVTHACESGETWESTPRKPWLPEFQKYLQDGKDPFKALSTASKQKDELATYWKARILLNLNLHFLAYHFFDELFRTSSDPRIKQASLVCLTEVHRQMPSFELPKPDAWKSLFVQSDPALFSLLLEQAPSESPALTLLHQPHSSFIRALISHGRRNSVEEVRNLREFLAKSAKDKLLSRYQEDAHLMLGRALYALGKFDESTREYAAIERSSNAQVDVFNESVWPLLQSGQHAKVVGLLQQLRSSALRTVFAPEPYLAAAISTLKLCLYPETTEIIRAYKSQYRASFEWLDRNREHPNLYNEAVQSLSGASKAPQKLTLEWVRSSTFLTRQRDINLLAKQESTLKGWIQSRPDLAPLLRELVAISDRELGRHRTRLVERINEDLRMKNRVLLSTLVQVRKALDNLENQILIQATADRVWLTANPGAKSRVEKPREIQTESDWNWGRFPASETDSAEIWEDEVGTAFRIRLEDRCKNKGRFLDLKFQKK